MSSSGSITTQKRDWWGRRRKRHRRRRQTVAKGSNYLGKRRRDWCITSGFRDAIEMTPSLNDRKHTDIHMFAMHLKNPTLLSQWKSVDHRPSRRSPSNCFYRGFYLKRPPPSSSLVIFPLFLDKTYPKRPPPSSLVRLFLFLNKLNYAVSLRIFPMGNSCPKENLLRKSRATQG